MRRLFITSALASLALAVAPQARAAGPYVGASLALAEMPLGSRVYLYMVGPSLEAGYRLGDRASVGVQGFLVGMPGVAQLAGLTGEFRYFFLVPTERFEPYGAVGLGIAQGDIEETRLLAVLLKLAAGARVYVGSRNLYVAAELAVVNFISLGGTLSFGVQF